MRLTSGATKLETKELFVAWKQSRQSDYELDRAEKTRLYTYMSTRFLTGSVSMSPGFLGVRVNDAAARKDICKLPKAGMRKRVQQWLDDTLINEFDSLKHAKAELNVTTLRGGCTWRGYTFKCVDERVPRG